MSNIITEEQDPLQQLDTDPASIPPSDDSLVATPHIESPKKAEHSHHKHYDTYLPIEDGVTYNLDTSQRLPNVLVTDEDIDTCIKMCNQYIKANKNDQASITKLGDLVEALYHVAVNMHGKDYESFFKNNINTLVQSVTGDKGSPIRITYQNTNIDENITQLSGNIAKRYLTKLTKTGSTTKFPLWHSGITLTIDPFTEQEMLDLNVALASHQITLGMETRGASFTGDDVHIASPIVDFILEHVVDSNLKDWNRTSLNKLISSKDIPALAAGALSAIYPSGYPVFHPCVTTNENNEPCKYNIIAKRKDNGDYAPDSKVDFTKILWVIDDAVSYEDRLHMTGGSRSKTQEEIKAYQTRLAGRISPDSKRATIWTKETVGGTVTIEVIFKTPSIAEYANTSNVWINSVKKMAEAALSVDEDLTNQNKDEKRNKLLNSYATVIDLVKHAGWIDYIAIKEPDLAEKVISEVAAIKDSLETFIMLEGVKETFEKAVQRYKEESIIAWTGIQNYECPVCKKGQTDPNSKTPSLIPINMLGYFFSTMALRRQTRHQMD